MDPGKFINPEDLAQIPVIDPYGKPGDKFIDLKNLVLEYCGGPSARGSDYALHLTDALVNLVFMPLFGLAKNPPTAMIETYVDPAKPDSVIYIGCTAFAAKLVEHSGSLKNDPRISDIIDLIDEVSRGLIDATRALVQSGNYVDRNWLTNAGFQNQRITESQMLKALRGILHRPWDEPEGPGHSRFEM